MSRRTGLRRTVAVAVLLAMTTSGVAANGDRDYRDRIYSDRGYDDREYEGFQWHRGLYATFLLGAATGGEVEYTDAFEPDLETGWLVGGTIGFDNLFFTTGGDFRLEAEISYRGQDVTRVPIDIGVTALLANIWYDFALGGRLVPYAGAGFGVGFFSDNFGDDSGFAWQLGGGLNYHISHRYLLGFNYRYLMAYTAVDYSAHQISASVGYKF